MEPAAIGMGEQRLARISAAFLAGFVVLLGVGYQRGWWFVGPDGLPADADFVNVWAAGRLALDGQPAAIYDWAVHRRMEVAILGHDFPGYYGWHYPPMLLLAAAPLATLPYVPAWLLWSGATALFMAWALWQVVPRAGVVLPLLAAPASLYCVVVGQNGMLTAGLMAATLAFLDRRPWLAGLFLGLLTYKPQFGLLFPLALLAGGYWRVLAGATVSALAFAGVSAVVFGIDTWAAFAASLGSTVGVLRDGTPGWDKLLSVYALLHPLGERVAWAAQMVVVAVLAVLVAWAFRRRMPAAPRAALLAVASVLAAPYFYVYDLPVLAVAGAFLARDLLERDYSDNARRVLALAMLAPALFDQLHNATIVVAALPLAGLALWRCRRPA
jgi:hypothetical protein